MSVRHETRHSTANLLLFVSIWYKPAGRPRALFWYRHARRRVGVHAAHAWRLSARLAHLPLIVNRRMGQHNAATRDACRS